MFEWETEQYVRRMDSKEYVYVMDNARQHQAKQVR